MPYLSRQLFFKFACIVIASLVTFAGVMMSMELLQQMPAEDTNLKFLSGTNLHFNYQTEQYEACSKCTSYHHAGEQAPFFPKTLVKICQVIHEQVSSGACCRKRLNRKWGPLPPPASRLLDDDFDDSKLRMTPQANQWHPFLRRTKGFLINYAKQSNSTQYIYLTPDPIPYAPAPAIAMAPLYGDDYAGDGEIIQWIDPDYHFFPPVTDWVEPPIA